MEHICAPRGNKPPPRCLPHSRGTHHFLGHCLFPSPPLGPRLTLQHTHTQSTISKMAGWAGWAGQAGGGEGGTDVLANRIFPGGGRLTESS